MTRPPEVGGSVTLSIRSRKAGHYRARLFVSLGVFALYVRGGATFGAAPERMMELGLLLKLPVVLR